MPPGTTNDVLDSAQKPRYQPDEMLVSLTHLPVVLGYLEDWGVERTRLERHEALGLARVRFKADRTVEESRRILGEGSTYDDWSPLDLAVDALREQSRRDHSGWIPTIGKNRIVGRVKVTQGLQFGGEKDTAPVPVDDLDDYLRPTGSRGAGVTVGLVDTPLLAHPWVVESIDPRTRDVQWQKGNVGGMRYHGTFVAGLILRRAPKATLLARRASTGRERDVWQLATTLATLADEGVPLINVSLCCYTRDNQPPLALTAALTAMGNRTLLVAAAGNHAKDDGSEPTHCRPAWPAAIDGVVAVGSLTESGEVAPDSPDMPWVDVFAQGDQVISSYGLTSSGGGTFARASGTSFAAAVVTGSIAAAMRDGSSARSAYQDIVPDPQDGERHVLPLPRVGGWPRDGRA